MASRRKHKRKAKMADTAHLVFMAFMLNMIIVNKRGISKVVSSVNMRSILFDSDDVPILKADNLLNDGANSFSACLIWMDEYNQLIEWIAFHYQVMSLRHLVIFRDPKSSQNLTPILDRWAPLMNIEVWTEREDFIDPEAMKKIKYFQLQLATSGGTHARASHAIHVRTQEEFYRGCAQHLQKLNRTWTAFIDTDERVVLNSQYFQNTTADMAEPGIILKTIQERQKRNKTQGRSQFERSCITLVRYQFDAIESPKEYVYKNVPPFVDPYRFHTLRFRHSQGKILLGKALGDVSHLNFDNVPMSPHRLIKDDKQCAAAWGQPGDILRIVHYIGSFEAFQRPGDRRFAVNRTERWITAGTVGLRQKGPPIGDEPRGWIQGFVDHFGEEASKYLLEDAGFPYNASTAMQEINTSCAGKCLEKIRQRSKRK